jgi:diguanylate cyclase (GGDEF)-like protein
MAVYVLVGCAALHPSARTVTSDEPTVATHLLPHWRLVLLAAASLVAPALVVDAGIQRAHLNLAVMGTASAVLFLLVLWRMAGLVRQISVQAAELEALSTTDPLTGVANRRRWDAELSTAVARAQRTLQPLAVALLDFDHFKAFNDTNGHPAGDALLSQATAGWQAHLRPGDLLARIGGEEFAVLLIACDQTAAGSTVERLRTAMPDGSTCSVGIALLEPGDSPADLVARADAALYRAKETGRNRAVTANPTPRPAMAPAIS